ncbi:transcription factor FapR [Desulfotomaculum copahuensis]|uniref:Fatty acid biosynthesis transcriptional regulator n=1 Tax=Desulfotomaculum copahuensis TaxID=1838280 RepID=A0A1B7LDT3_9FIRM|nr:transcription factor FapR [Desulfotomaculum copahuensis]OAT81266.1 fatty acid biosynthesis transcriptional regulator [Desulfotomaculum copahuensis]
MIREHLNREHRQQLLSRYLAGNPFLTDEELAGLLGVSVQTVRLDRGALRIPEFRERLARAARGAYRQPRALTEDELVGELVDLEVGRAGISVLTVTEEMTLSHTRVARGHFLFAQANSLAVALCDATVALTGTAKVSFRRPVYCREKVVARGVVRRKKGNKYMVRVTSTVRNETVLEGKFLIFAIAEEEWRQ